MSNEADLAERFTSAVKRKGVTPLELFEEYDRWNRGTISFEILEKCLSSISFYIKPNEYEILKKNYNSNNLFEYKKFCKDIGPSGSLTLSRSINVNNNNRQYNLQKIAKEFRYIGLNLFDYLKDYDTNHDGKVPMAVFLQAVNGNPLIRSVVDQYYNQTTNEVNYFQFQRDIDSIEFSEPIEKVTKPIPEIFKSFSEDVCAQSVSFYEAFSAYDQYKRGKVTQTAFLASIGKYGLQYSPYQLQLIMQPFISPDGLVNYNLFCEEIEKFAPAKDETKEFDTSSPLEPLLEFLKNDLKNRRIHLNNILRGKMARENFFNILLAHRIELSPNDKEAIIKAFSASPTEIDCDGFIEKVDPISVIPQTTVELVVERLRKHLKNTDQSLLLHLRNFDRENSKTVSLLQFRSALNSIQFDASGHEIVQISQQFGDGNSIQYDGLCKQVESKAIETEAKDVYNQVATPTKSRYLDLFTRIHNVTDQYKIDLRGEFAQTDPRKRGIIPLFAFKKVLGNLPIRLAGEDFYSLIESYTDSYTQSVYYNKFCDDLESIGPTHTITPRKVISPRATGSNTSANSSPYSKRSFDLDNSFLDLPKQTSYIDSIRDQILTTLKKCVAAGLEKRLTIGDLFSYHDISGDGFVNTKDVRAILQPYDTFLDEKSYAEIIDSFSDRRMPEKFAWRRFFSAVTDTTLTSDEQAFFAQKARIKQGSGLNVALICNCVRERLVARKKRVETLFGDICVDRISEQSFRDHLERSGFSLQENEMVALFNHYQTDDFSGIRWRTFCEDVEKSRPMAYNYC